MNSSSSPWGAAMAGCVWLLPCAGLLAQQQATPAETAREGRAQAQALEKKLPVPTLTPKASFDLSPARQERFQKFLPKAWRKLTQREPLHVLVLTDASTLEVHEGKETDSFPFLFANRLANQFFYTGGAQPFGTAAISPEVPVISIRTLARQGAGIQDAQAILESSARQAPVDVVMLCYGSLAEAGTQPAAYARSLASAIAAVRVLGAEPVLCSPWLPVADKCETVLGLAAPLADVAREVSDELGIFHANLGDLSRLMTVPEPPTRDDGQLFERIEKTYREFFHMDESGHYAPRASLHRQLGTLLYKDLLDAPAGPAWKIDEATAAETEPGKWRVTFSLRNAGSKEAVFTALPLISTGWKPVEASPGTPVPAGASRPFSVYYTASGRPLPLAEPLLRLPVLISSGSIARVETLHAAPSPASIVWGLETLFNQEKEFLIGCQVVNTDKKTLKGSWQAQLGDQKLQGSLDLSPQATLPLNLRFNLPPELVAKNGPVPLVVTVKTESQEMVSTRQVQITRNLGLGQAVALTVPDKPASDVFLTPLANARALTLQVEFPTALLQEAAEGSGAGPAWLWEVNLDARSYGKRLEQGCTAALRLSGSAADGDGRLQPVPAWAFGTGYAAGYDLKEFKSSLATRGDRRVLSLSIPRTYLYLHEWALENGNSQLGLSVRVSLRGADGYQTFVLPASVKAPRDVESLCVLELTAKPTQRVTLEVQ